MKLTRYFSTLLGGQLQIVLVVFSSLVAALTVALNTVIIARVAQDYLADAEADVVINLAKAFYQLKQDEMAVISTQLVLDPQVIQNLAQVREGQVKTVEVIDSQITNKITGIALGGTHLIAMLDADGDILAGRVVSPEGNLSPMISGGNWGSLPIVAQVLSSGREQVGTEIISARYLTQVGLHEQALIALTDTRLAVPEPFDPREGTAGLALTGVYPVRDASHEIIGTVVSAYLFNNDFTLVDRIKEVGGIETVTIFFGDLRVSTNVMTDRGERAVGTRISQAVREVVLEQGQPYVGRAYVVSEWYVTRYEPLRDHQGHVVGSLYVGNPESAFLGLVQVFNQRVVFIALVPGILAALIAVPIARAITRPISELVEAHRRLAAGDMTVRVQAHGGGEVAVLGRSFNSMADTLHNTQKELLHKERLASMGQLAAGVAHEINNPLGTILLFAEAALKDVPEEGPQREDLRMIIGETTRCKSIVADLLNFARQQEVMAQETDLHALLDQVIAEVSLQPAFQGVQMMRQFIPGLPAIQADAGQLQQVFINLLNNGAQAMEGEGTITLTTRSVENQWVEIAVADTGCGIPQENLGKLFTPFFTTKPPGRGTGLGLSIVYGIVKMHRGQITVQSQVGQGTTFTVTLPVRLSQSRWRSSSGGAGEVIG